VPVGYAVGLAVCISRARAGYLRRAIRGRYAWVVYGGYWSITSPSGFYTGRVCSPYTVLYVETLREDAWQDRFFVRQRPHGFWSSHLALAAAQFRQASAARSLRFIVRDLPSPSRSWVASCRVNRSLGQQKTPRQLDRSGRRRRLRKRGGSGGAYARLNLLGQRVHAYGRTFSCDRIWRVRWSARSYTRLQM